MRIRSLRTRLLFGLAVLFTCTMAALGWALITEARTRQAQFELEQARFQVKTLAEASIDAVIAEDFELMERWVRAAMPSTRYAYAALVRLDGKVLTHSDSYYIGRVVNTPRPPTPDEVVMEYRNRSVRELHHPILAGGHHLANAHIAYYLDDKSALVGDILKKISLMLTLLLATLGVGAVAISRKIVAPIESLTVAVRDASFEAPARLEHALDSRPDEVGLLARAFNTLIQRLAQSYDELKNANAVLEGRIEERTADLVSAVKKLEVSHARIEAIMNNVAEGIVTFNKDGIVESVNPAALALCGCTADEVIGSPFDVLVSLRDGHEPANNFVASIAHASSSGAMNIVREVSIRRNDGTLAVMEVGVSSVSWDGMTTYIGVIRNITERKQMIDQLRYVAEHDSLTGLYNRAYFDNALERVILRAKRSKETSALLYIDLDRFKQINDTLGHAAGDRALNDVAAILSRRTRMSDVVARLGGDEFVILLYDITKALTERVADSFRTQIMAYRLNFDGVEMQLGCSIGVVYIDENAVSLQDVMAKADAACYDAKRDGRNAVRVYVQ